jgi:hypothetical protein
MGEAADRRAHEHLSMAGKRRATVFLALVVATVTIAAAHAAALPGMPASSTMALTVTDVPGALVAGQGALATGDMDVANAYSREFLFKSPYGASKYVVLREEVLVTTSEDNAATEYRVAGHLFSSRAFQRSIANSFVASLKLKKGVARVTTIKARALGFGDSALEAGSIVHGKNGSSINISLSLYRVGKVVVLNIAEGEGSQIVASDARTFGTLGMAHIDAALIPIVIAPAVIAGTPLQGQTLTASPGTWGDEPASYGYQWQHCDAAGANCTDVAGATASTYAVTAAEVDFTLHVAVTATNRFGSASSVSAVTAVAA